MRLNYDCVRDVLLKLEELLTIKYDENSESFDFDMVDIKQLYDSLSNTDYTIEDVLYTVKILDGADFISASMNYGDGRIVDCIIIDITYEGTEFINKVRPKDIWSKLKGGFVKAGAVSLPIISSIASSLVTSLVKSHIGLL